MRTYYYLRLCNPMNYLPLGEYIGKNGIVHSMDDFEALLTFDTRNEAGEYLDAHRKDYPERIVQICFHLGKDQRGTTPGIIHTQINPLGSPDCAGYSIPF